MTTLARALFCLSLAFAVGTVAAESPSRSGPLVASVAQDPRRPAVPGTVVEVDDYSHREALAPELAEFRGGHGVVTGVLVGVAVVILVLLLV